MSFLDHFIVLDTETTGVDVLKDRVVQSYIGLFSAADLSRPLFSQEIIWQAPADMVEQTSEIHGISPKVASLGVAPNRARAMLRDSLARLKNQLPEAPLVAYNAAFDISLLAAPKDSFGYSGTSGRMLNAVLQRFDMLDPLILDKQLDKFRKGKRNLASVARHYGSASEELLEKAHDARFDCEITARVLVDIVEKYRLERGWTLSQLHAAQKKWAVEQKLSFAKFRGLDLAHEAGWPIQQQVLDTIPPDQLSSSGRWLLAEGGASGEAVWANW